MKTLSNLSFSEIVPYIGTDNNKVKEMLSGEVLPYWETVRDVILSLCDYLSSLEYFGFDIMITDEGVKLCEINTLPALCGAQVLCGPVMKRPLARDFFIKKIKAKLNN